MNKASSSDWPKAPELAVLVLKWDFGREFRYYGGYQKVLHDTKYLIHWQFWNDSILGSWSCRVLASTVAQGIDGGVQYEGPSYKELLSIFCGEGLCWSPCSWLPYDDCARYSLGIHSPTTA